MKTIKDFVTYIASNSQWEEITVRRLVKALGYSVSGGLSSLKELSGNLSDCARHGADSGFPGFTYYNDTIAFYFQNRDDINRNLEASAAEIGEDLFSMVQHFGAFRHSDKPAAHHIGRAIYGKESNSPDLTGLYNVFALYCLEEISHTWDQFLYENPGQSVRLSA